MIIWFINLNNKKIHHFKTIWTNKKYHLNDGSVNTVYLLENDYSSYKQSVPASTTLKEKLHGKKISYRTK